MNPTVPVQPTNGYLVAPGSVHRFVEWLGTGGIVPVILVLILVAAAMIVGTILLNARKAAQRDVH